MFSSAKHSIVGHWSSGGREKSPPCGLPMATTSIYIPAVRETLQEAPLRLIQVHTQNTKYKRATKKNWGAFFLVVNWIRSQGSAVSSGPSGFSVSSFTFPGTASTLGSGGSAGSTPCGVDAPSPESRLRPSAATNACWASLQATSKRNNRVFGRTRISQVRNKPVSLYVTSSKHTWNTKKKPLKKWCYQPTLPKVQSNNFSARKTINNQPIINQPSTNHQPTQHLPPSPLPPTSRNDTTPCEAPRLQGWSPALWAQWHSSARRIRWLSQWAWDMFGGKRWVLAFYIFLWTVYTQKIQKHMLFCKGLLEQSKDLVFCFILLQSMQMS